MATRHLVRGALHGKIAHAIPGARAPTAARARRALEIPTSRSQGTHPASNAPPGAR